MVLKVRTLYQVQTNEQKQKQKARKKVKSNRNKTGNITQPLEWVVEEGNDESQLPLSTLRTVVNYI